jgi:NAD(P)-dependent dehydrogenase (short-subunit alcohol dehydrogenase family)
MRALVTGGAKRLGREISVYLANRGYNVAIHYNNSESEALDLAKEINSLGQISECIKGDLLVEDQVKDLVPAASEAIGGQISLLVNNASIFEYDSFEDATRESWDRHIESNLRAPFVLTQAFARQSPSPVLDNKNEPISQGLVLNMIDQRVKKLTPDFASYTIAKMGLWALTQTAARALAPEIRVNAIGPGPTLIGARQKEYHFDGQRKNTILQRGANADDITSAVGYFIDAKSVTGQLLCVDGGQHLGWKTPDIQGVE